MWAHYIKASEENVSDLTARVVSLRAAGEATLAHFAQLELQEEQGRLEQLRKLDGAR